MAFSATLRRKIATVLAWKTCFATSYDLCKAGGLFLTGRRGGALSRVIVAVRMARDPEPLYLRCASSDFVTLHELFINREYGSVVPHAPPAVRGILHLRANIGLAPRWFARIWPAAEVVAVEPDQGNVALLRRNLAANGPHAKAPRIVNAFMGGRARRAVLKSFGPGFPNEGVLSDDAPRRGEMVLPVVTPEELVQTAGIPIDLVKMDVEGAEKEILEGDLTWLDNCRVLVLEIHEPLNQAWLADIVENRLLSWQISAFESRHSGVHLAILGRQQGEKLSR